MNNLIYKLPVPVKLHLGNIKTLLDCRKRAEIKEVDHLICNEYPRLNSIKFKSALKKFLASNSWNSIDVKNFLQWLYTDEITIIHKSNMKKELPIIICVVKNEADKLINFFKHYKNIGSFNYVFLDNGSKDNTVDIIIENGGTVYQCLESFSTNRKLSWINKVYSTFPNGSWTVLLDADELLVYNGYETNNFNDLLHKFDEKRIDLVGAVMVDMFSTVPCDKNDYIDKYIYFQNNFHEEKSVYFNSIYGGIREREFRIKDYDFGNGRSFLIKKHPVIKKSSNTLLIHCHFIYPFFRNYKSNVYFALLHYKLFDSEIEKYKKIALNGGYGNFSAEYKSYIKKFSEKNYEDIFKPDRKTVRYEGTYSLEKIQVIEDARNL